MVVVAVAVVVGLVPVAVVGVVVDMVVGVLTVVVAVLLLDWFKSSSDSST